MANPLPHEARTDDPRFQRSLKALRAAVLGLVEAGPLADLSITRLVQTAGVTRPTFYQHFADIPDAARRVALALLDQAFPVPPPFPAGVEITPDSLFARIEGNALPVIRHLQAHRSFYVNVLEGAGNAAFFEEVVTFLSGRFLPEGNALAPRDPHGDRMTVMAGGLMWLVVRWLRDDGAADAPEPLARRAADAAVSLLLPVNQKR